MDGMGWMRLDEMVIRGRRSTSTFGANKTLNLIRTMCSTVYFCKIELQCCTVALVSSGCCHQIARLHLIALLVLQVNWPEILIISFCNISYHTICIFPKDIIFYSIMYTLRFTKSRQGGLIFFLSYIFS